MTSRNDKYSKGGVAGQGTNEINRFRSPPPQPTTSTMMLIHVRPCCRLRLRLSTLTSSCPWTVPIPANHLAWSNCRCDDGHGLKYSVLQDNSSPFFLVFAFMYPYFQYCVSGSRFPWPSPCRSRPQFGEWAPDPNTASLQSTAGNMFEWG